MDDETCPDCGGELKFLEKDSSSGREYREYRCLKCGKLVTLGGHVALWQMLHDANEERARLAQPGQSGDRAPAETAVKRPWWRFWTRRD